MFGGLERWRQPIGIRGGGGDIAPDTPAPPCGPPAGAAPGCDRREALARSAAR